MEKFRRQESVEEKRKGKRRKKKRWGECVCVVKQQLVSVPKGLVMTPGGAAGLLSLNFPSSIRSVYDKKRKRIKWRERKRLVYFYQDLITMTSNRIEYLVSLSEDDSVDFITALAA